MNDDLISRKAAFDAMNDVIVDYIPTLFGHLQKIPLELARAIVRLPAAKPHVVTMKLEVDKESLKKAMEEAELTLLPTEKRGKWIQQDHNYKYGNVSTCLYFAPVCSECGNTGDFKMNYCPNCGAKMEESDGNSD